MQDLRAGPRFLAGLQQEDIILMDYHGTVLHQWPSVDTRPHSSQLLLFGNMICVRSGPGPDDEAVTIVTVYTTDGKLMSSIVLQHACSFMLIQKE